MPGLAPASGSRGAAAGPGGPASRSGLGRLAAALRRTPPDAAAQPAAEAGAPSALRQVGARARQLLDPKRVLHEPAVRFEGDWGGDVPSRICAAFAEERAAHDADGLDVAALARVRALEFERKQGDSLAPGQRLLPPGSSKSAYHDAQLRAFLEAIGEQDPDAVIASFANIGTGALHRVNVVGSNALGSAVGVAQTLVPEPATKAALTGVRAVMQGLNGAAVFDSAGRRLRTSGADNLMAKLRADAPPGAKTGPGILAASNAVLGDLADARKTLRRIETAMTALDDAQERQAARPSPAGERDVERARDDLDIAFARHCHQARTKAGYKAASESAKVDWRGAQRNLVMNSYVGGSAGIAAGIVGLLTPAVVAAPVSAGVSAGAAGLAVGLYLAYQLGSGPSKDGQAKARRAFVALGKSGDILGGNAQGMQDKRAQAYGDYVQARGQARWKGPQTRKRLHDEARQALVQRLRSIAADDEVQPTLDARENWQAVVDHGRAKAASGDPAADPEAALRVTALDEGFARAHGAKFDKAVIAGAIKTPLAIRFEDASKLVAGKVAHAQRKLLEFDEQAARGKLRRPGREGRERDARGRLVETLKQHLADGFNLELAVARVHAGRARAGAALGAVGDADVQALFCGDGRAQVDAENVAKRLTAGELDRFVYTIGGAGVAGIAAGGLAATGDLARSIGVAADLPRAPAELAATWKSEALVPQATGPLTSQDNGSNGAPFMKSTLPRLLDPLKRQGDPIEIALTLPASANGVVDRADPATDAALDDLVARMSAVPGIADRLPLEGLDDAPAAVVLNATADYFKRQYDQASLGDKARFHARQSGEIASEIGTSLAAHVWQAAAQVPLAATRQPIAQAQRLAPAVRQRLIDAERQAAAAVPAAETPEVIVTPATPDTPPSPSTPTVSPVRAEEARGTSLDADFVRDFSYLAPLLDGPR